MGCVDGREIRHVPGSEWGTKGPWSVGQVSVVQGLGRGWMGYLSTPDENVPFVGVNPQKWTQRGRWIDLP